MADEILVRDENGDLAVRTTTATGDVGGSKDDVYTRDENGNLCVRVTGSGSGGGGGSSADVETLKDQVSVLATSTDLSEEIGVTTVVLLDELVAMPIDGRPSYKKAGATVYAENGVTGIISTVDDVNGTAEIVTVSVSGADAVIFREW